MVRIKKTISLLLTLALVLTSVLAISSTTFAAANESAKIVSPANGSTYETNKPITVKAKVDGYGSNEGNFMFTYLVVEVRHKGKQVKVSEWNVWDGKTIDAVTFTPTEAGAYEILACVYYDTKWGTWHVPRAYVGTPDQKISITVKAPQALKANPLKVKAKTATIKYSKLKKKNRTLAVGKVMSFTKKGKGKITYAKVSGNKKITINKKSGKVTVKKKLKKGTYKVKVKVKAAGTAKYKAATKTVTLKIKVK